MKKLALIVGSIAIVAAIAAVVYRYFGYDEDNVGGDAEEEEDIDS